MPRDTGTLRFKIDGRWTANNMVASIQDVNFLYNLRLFLDIVDESAADTKEFYQFLHPRIRPRLWGSPYWLLSPLLFRPDEIRQLSGMYFPDSVLQIARIEYASPGEKDFFGDRISLAAIWELVFSLITLKQTREGKELKNNAQRIENARNFVRLRVEYERAENEIRELQGNRLAEIVDENTRGLQRLVEENLITDVLMLEEKISEGGD